MSVIDKWTKLISDKLKSKYNENIIIPIVIKILFSKSEEIYEIKKLLSENEKISLEELMYQLKLIMKIQPDPIDWFHK